MNEKTRDWLYNACVWAAPLAALITAFVAVTFSIQGVLAGVGLSITLALVAVATKK